MWLLDTERFILNHFSDPSEVVYAILSHVWRDHEQTFQEIRSITGSPQGSPPLHVSAKIRFFCLLALQHGYKWAWVDTCCIDKTSSVELSEAINSMYHWYAKAAVCYAYLDDVPRAYRPEVCHIRLPGLEQGGLADLIQTRMGINRDILKHGRHLSTVSIARRMSWAARRQASRQEDLAYALMGIFDVHVIYGEGQHVFIRLQEEILKQSSDQTIFAWGKILASSPSYTFSPKVASRDAFYAEVEDTLLAPSPAASMHSGGFIPVSPKVLSGFLGNPTILSEYTVTSHGIRTQLRLFPLEVTTWEPLSLAILACWDDSKPYIVGLYLRRHHWAPSEAGPYTVGDCFTAIPANTAPPVEKIPYYRGARFNLQDLRVAIHQLPSLIPKVQTVFIRNQSASASSSSPPIRPSMFSASVGLEDEEYTIPSVTPRSSISAVQASIMPSYFRAHPQTTLSF
ncbi:heterokaryon incompatibility protein-domain-containing protein [Daedaleopsis nitida]|nr:heterokaryon incompatibility protein-domain-containing protein [Daedaleopsis nitida]